MGNELKIDFRASQCKNLLYRKMILKNFNNQKTSKSPEEYFTLVKLPSTESRSSCTSLNALLEDSRVIKNLSDFIIFGWNMRHSER